MTEKFAIFVTKYRKLIIIFYIILLLPSLIGLLITKTNYNFLSYVPSNMNSKIGDTLIRKYFGVTDSGVLAISNESLEYLVKTKKQIEKIKGLKRVIWIDNFADIAIPVEYLPDEIKQKFFSKNSTLFSFRLEDNLSNEQKTKILSEIRDISKMDALLGGELVVISELQEKIKKETVIYTIIAFVVLYLVLAYMMKSLLIPIIFLVSMGVAILLNMGTNVFKGSVSFLTISIAPIMQLGTSMDYAIFLLHRFDEEKKNHNSIVVAMMKAISKSMVAISASALTTVAGFAALIFMKNGIGSDLGYVLCKGILITLIVNFTLLPCLLLIFNKIVEKYRINIRSISFEGFSRWSLKWRWVIFATIIIITIPSYLMQKNNSYYFSNEKNLQKNSPSIVQSNEIKNTFNINEQVYLISKDEGSVTEKVFSNELLKIKNVDSVVGLSNVYDIAIPESFIPNNIKEEFVDDGYRYLTINLLSKNDDKETFLAVTNIRNLAKQYYKEFYLTGQAALTKDLADIRKTDSTKVELISIVLILIIIALSFKSLSLPFILVLVVQLAIWVNLSIPYLQHTAIFSLTPIFIGAIQLGATIDYAILFTSRYIEYLHTITDKYEAVKKTIVSTGSSILTSAFTMFSATLGIYLISSIRTAREITLLVGRGALISMVLIFLGLPSMLILFDKIIRKTSRKI